MLRHTLGVTAGGGGVLTALLTAGWTGAVLLAGVVIVLVGAVCWVVADPDRPGRLALLITSWRGRGPARTARVRSRDEPAAPTAATD